MRCALYVSALALLWSCGAGKSATLPAAEQSGLCQAILEQIAGEFGCRASEIPPRLADPDDRFTVQITFEPKGRMASFRDLRAIDMQAEGVPPCVEKSIRGLRIGERGQSVEVPLAIRYVSSAEQSVAEVGIDGTCQLTAALRQ